MTLSGLRLSVTEQCCHSALIPVAHQHVFNALITSSPTINIMLFY